MIGGIGLLGWHYAAYLNKEPAPVPPLSDPLAGLKPTPSMKATGKYFWLVLALFLTQILLGAFTAHYQVEGHDFYGIALSEERRRTSLNSRHYCAPRMPFRAL